MTGPGKVVIVSGGTFGIGRAITLGLAGRGHAVVAFGLEAPQVSSIAQSVIPSLRAELSQRGLKAELMEADVSRSGDVTSVVDAALARADAGLPAGRTAGWRQEASPITESSVRRDDDWEYVPR